MLKRTLDILLAFLGILLLWPVILLISLIIRYQMGRPVFFVQTRTGLNGQPFQMIKFRTMRELRDLDGRLLPDKLRITKFGNFLRASSLDELPELLNVIMGEMSLVGPRPLLIEYLPLYSSQQARRHDVRPGITGWAQVNGRNTITWDEKFALDIWYVDNQSLKLDVKIMLLTFLKVLKREGISASEEVTMSKFKGSKS